MLVIYKADVAAMTGKQEDMVFNVLKSGGFLDDMRTLMRSSNYGALCLDNGCFHGVALVRVTELADKTREHEILAVCTAPEWRRRGVATELVSLITSESSGSTVRVCVQRGTSTNESLVQFFEKRGFVIDVSNATGTHMKSVC